MPKKNKTKKIQYNYLFNHSPVDQVHEYIVLLDLYFVFQNNLLFEIILHQVNHKHEQHFLFKYFFISYQKKKNLVDYLRKAETFSRNLNPPPDVQILGTAPG